MEIITFFARANKKAPVVQHGFFTLIGKSLDLFFIQFFM